MDWTKEQSDAIYKKDSNILVAAAAGSGKTAVLVERIIQKILNDGIDIDKLLVCTFTNAAAAEMRERVLDAIYKKLDEDPDNENLKKQVVLLGKSNICTIHSFCLDVIKNNFFETDVSSNFRIATEQELEILKQDVLEELFENYYESEDKDFEKLIETYTSYRGDEPLKELVLNIYKFMQSAPFPNEWLQEKVALFKQDDTNVDFGKSIWGKILLDSVKEEIFDAITSLKNLRNKLALYIELDDYTQIIDSDIENLKVFYDKCDLSWDEAYEASKVLLASYTKWKTNKKIVLELKDEAKQSRDSIKKKVKAIIDQVLVYDSASAYQDIYDMYEVLSIMEKVILSFDEAYHNKKHEKNVIDFNDIEHYALKILTKKEDGKIMPSDVAKVYQSRFEEIAIDEYQDSNQVQETILTMVSRGNNVFMVGDVKQSIYKFRQACPDLFLDKYNRYSINEANNDGLKIQLFKNFRSRENVLDITNAIFSAIMTHTLGDIDYTKEEYLNLGASFDEELAYDKKAELNVIDLMQDAPIEAWKEDEEEQAEEEENPDETIKLDKAEIEAKYVVSKIKELIDSKMQISDRKLGKRDITYKDIVILLRSTSKYAPIYEKELVHNNIPVFSDASSEYLDTIEIQTILNVLKVINNPREDIPFVSVLRSQIGKFTDNEIIEIRLCDRTIPFYDTLLKAKEELKGELQQKLVNFMNLIDHWRKLSAFYSLGELILKIYQDTGYFDYVAFMPNGSVRQANLKMLMDRAEEYEDSSYKGIHNFIRFVEKLRNSNSDMSAAKVIGENENVVRIMSIHKSKGLEFPVVFLSSTAKQINLQDLNSDLLLHQSLGIGPQYINYEKKIEYSTSAKDAMKIIVKNESIAEEMRVLYVALTRAKEKLIITGVSKDFTKDIAKKRELLNTYNLENGKINPSLLKKYTSYLDWIELVILNDSSINNLISLNRIDKNEIMKDEQEETEEVLRDIDFKVKPNNVEKLDEYFKWKYDDDVSMTLPLKTTVSKIKGLSNDEYDLDKLTNEDYNMNIYLPDFMKTEEELNEITSAKRGTLMHSFLQRIDFRKDYTYNDLKEYREKLVFDKIYSLEEANSINLKKIENFLNSGLADKIRSCKVIKKEEPFCIRLSAKELNKNATHQEIIVQGVIDLFAITNDNKIILVDYKTDFVENNNEEILITRYKKQLEIYKQALEESCKLKVEDVYIYSLYLNKEIKLSI